MIRVYLRSSILVNRGMDYWIKKLLDLEIQVANSEKIGCPISPYGNSDRFYKEDFEDIIEVEFENHIFPACKGYDRVLTTLYGEYMELPPIDKRVSRHNVVAYWRN